MYNTAFSTTFEVSKLYCLQPCAHEASWMKLLVLAIDYSFIRIVARVSYYTEFKVEYIPFSSQGYQSNRILNIPPGIPLAFDVFCCPGGREFD